jgi:hypothetical protein
MAHPPIDSLEEALEFLTDKNSKAEKILAAYTKKNPGKTKLPGSKSDDMYFINCLRECLDLDPIWKV